MTKFKSLTPLGFWGKEDLPLCLKHSPYLKACLFGGVLLVLRIYYPWHWFMPKATDSIWHIERLPPFAYFANFSAVVQWSQPPEEGLLTWWLPLQPTGSTNSIKNNLFAFQSRMEEDICHQSQNCLTCNMLHHAFHFCLHFIDPLHSGQAGKWHRNKNNLIFKKSNFFCLNLQALPKLFRTKQTDMCNFLFLPK